MTLSDDLLATLLTHWRIARLSTVTVDQHPHSVPVVFCAHRGLIYVPVDGKRKSGAQLRRFANVSANSAATLLLDDYREDWQQLWWVRIDADAQECKPDRVVAASIGAALLAKYPQYQTPSLRFAPDRFLQLRPTRVVVWAQSNSAETISAAIARETRT